MKKIVFIFLFLMMTMPVLAKDKTKTDIPYNEIENRLLQNADIEEDNTITKQEPIYDELINDTFTSNISDKDVLKVIITKNSPRIIKAVPDELMSKDYIDKSKTIRIIEAKKDYDFSQQEIPIKIKIAKDLNFKNYAAEGDVIPFIAMHDFKIQDTTYKEGTIILGRIETISASDKMGVPETVKIDNFYIDVDNDNKFDNDINLQGHITKTGANRSIWIYPLYQAGNIAFYAAGFIFVPVHGGHAKISQEEEFTLFYETSSEAKKDAQKQTVLPQKQVNSGAKKKKSSAVKKRTRK